jgi:hypothetical protein
MSTITTMFVFGLITVLVFAAFAPVVTCVVLRGCSIMVKWAYDKCSEKCADIVIKCVKYATTFSSRIINTVNHIVTWIVDQYVIFIDCILNLTRC